MSVNLAEKDFYKNFSETFGEKALFNVKASEFTTLKTGGPVSIMVFPGNIDEIKSVIKLCAAWGLEYLPIGRGSNILFSDNGFKGVVINLAEKMNRFRAEGGKSGDIFIIAQAGAFLPEIVSFCAEKAIGGIEWAMGIPGTAAGAVKGNAGAFGHSVSDFLEKLRLVSGDAKEKEADGSQITSGYRYAEIEEGAIISEVTLKLHLADAQSMKKKMEEYRGKRTLSQPTASLSAGSVFKNISHVSAGKLIDECGLRGMRVGDAIVSEKHANFIINEGNASSGDILELMRRVRDEVHSRKGIILQPEIKIIGERL